MQIQDQYKNQLYCKSLVVRLLGLNTHFWGWGSNPSWEIQILQAAGLAKKQKFYFYTLPMNIPKMKF